jgi:hypothetical protein
MFTSGFCFCTINSKYKEVQHIFSPKQGSVDIILLTKFDVNSGSGLIILLTFHVYWDLVCCIY